MGYHIDYLTGEGKSMRGKRRIRLPILSLLCFGVFLLLVECRWPEGRDFLRNTFLGDQKTIAVSALNDLADGLRHGEGLQTAFSDFWENLLS